MKNAKKQQNRSVDRSLPDSSASVAGYEYQFLWTALRCLNLLAPNAKAIQVVVESLYGPDIEALEAEDEDLLIVDVSEYEGGESLQDAERIIVSQLKYSPTAPNKTWTINGLCSSRTDNPSRSIIGGLGLIFQRFCERVSAPEELPNTLSLRLVTNRPLQDKARSSIEKAKALIAGRKSTESAQTRWLLGHKSLTATDKENLSHLYSTSGLKSRQFTTFLACFDTSGFKEPGLNWLDTLARKTLIRMGGSWRQDVLQELLSRVRKEAIEQRCSPIGAEDVLAYFFCDHMQFLPAPNRIALPGVLIETEDAVGLATRLADSRCRQILVHGTGGRGKSITVSQIEGQLPVGSHVLVYDCFANGEWEGSSHGFRHSSIRFCTQVTNELAVTCNTGLFYSQRNTARQDRWTLVVKALRRVDKQLPDGAVFVLVVDAADNARDAYNACSEYDRDDLLLDELWKLPLPDKIRLVVTCRTNRRRDVGAPNGVEEFPLAGFRPEESAALLSQRVGSVSHEAEEAFHNATDGTPRLQDYWITNDILDLAPEEREEHILGRQSYGFEKEYASWLESASNGLPSTISGHECVALLRCMRQPFFLADFAACMGLSEEDAHDFCVGLHSGLVLTEHHAIEFRDQDFEAVLDASLSDKDRMQAHHRCAEWCMESAQHQFYAAKNVAYHLDRAQLYPELIKQSLDLSFLGTLPRPDDRDSCATECVHLALHACRTQRDYASPLRLIFSLARLARSREAGEWLFLEYPDICVRHGLHPSVRKTLLQSDEGNGGLHFRIAYALAQLGDMDTAKQHLEEGEAWLSKLIAQPDNRVMWNQVFNMSHGADYGLACALVYGIGEGFSVARRWKSKAAQTQGVFTFAEKAERLSPGLVTGCLREAKVSNPMFLAAILAGVFRAHVVPSGGRVRECLRAILKNSKVWRSEFQATSEWMVGFAELCLRRRADAAAVLQFVGKHPLEARSLSTFHVSRTYWEGESHDFLMGLALRRELEGKELTLADLYPEKEGASGYDYHRNEFKSTIGKVLPAYKLRAKALHKNWNASRAWREVEKSLQAWHSKDNQQNGRYQPFFHTYALHIVDTILLLSGSHLDCIDALVARGEELLYPPDFADFCMDMAEVCIQRGEYRSVAEDLALKSVEVAGQSPRKAKARCALLLRASALLQDFDGVVAAKVFGEAFSAAQDVDEDAQHFANALSRTARAAGVRASGSLSDLAQQLWRVAGALEQCAEEEDGINWGVALEGITALDDDLGYAALWELDRTGMEAIQEALPHFINGTLAARSQGEIASLAGVLAPLCAVDSRSIATLTRLLAHLPTNQFGKRAFSFLARLVTLNSGHEQRESLCRKLLQLASSMGLKNETTEALDDTAEFYSEGSNWQRRNYSSGGDSAKTRRGKLQRLRTRLEKGTLDADPSKAVDAIIASGAHGSNLKDLLVWQGNRQRGGGVAHYLDALCAVKGDGYYAHDATLAEAISQLLESLPQRRTVEKWIETRFVSYMVQAYPALTAYDADYAAAAGLLELDCVDWATRAQAVLEILCEYGHRLPPRRLHELGGTFAGLSPSCSPAEVLSDELSAVPGTADPLVGPALSKPPAELCARLICDAFNHVDNRVRWRAMHAFRLAVTWDAEPFLAAVVALLQSRHGRLWMSARDWLLFSLLHISRKEPVLVSPHVQALWDIAVDDTFPHAGHQELARRILEHIDAGVPGALTPEQRSELPSLNRPRTCLLGRDAESVGHQTGLRFHFDSMDTMPYWYSRLGNAFGLHRCDVAVRAEKWVCDEWGLSEAECREKEDHSSRSYDWGLTSHRQGGRPTVERYTRYVEWHAMMMAAGEMVRELPGRIQHYSGCDEDQWECWVGSRAFAADIAVLSDLRGPVPLDPVLHGARLGDDAASRPLTVDDYRRAFMASRSDVCVAGNYSAKASGVSWSWDVDTALVSRKTARALAISILSARNLYGVGIPFFSIKEISDIGRSCIDALAAEDYRLDEEMLMESDPFELRPWVVACYSEEELAGKDPMWRESGRNWYALDSDVISELRLDAGEQRTIYTGRDQRKVAWCQIWNDELIDSQHRDRDYSAGSRLVMRRDAAVQFLKRKGMDLIVRVGIRRYVERSYGSEKAKYKEEAGVFILRQSGRLETVGIRAEPRGETDF